MEPVETAKEDYAFKECKCHVCGLTREATFTFDYYPSSLISPNGCPYLICEGCFQKQTSQVFEEPVKTKSELEYVPERRKKKERPRPANMWETL